MIGFPEPTSRVGQVFPDSPAWQIGLVPGDRITALNGKPCRLFSDIRLAMLDRKPVLLSIERTQNGSLETIQKGITPTMSKNQLAPTIGIYPSPSIRIATNGPVPALLDPAEIRKAEDALRDVATGDVLVAMNGSRSRRRPTTSVFRASMWREYLLRICSDR